MKVYMVRSDGGSLTQDFLQNSYCGIGWEAMPELPGNVEWSRVEEAYKAAYPDDAKMRRAVNVGQLYRFLSEIQVGDIVLTPGAGGVLHAGYVRGEPTWVPGTRFPRRRKVDWSLPTIHRFDASIPLQNSLRSSQSVFTVHDAAQVFQLLGLKVAAAERLKTVDQSDHYEVVRKRLLELHPTSFEQLVSYALRALGFEAQQQTGHVGDKGVDYSGELDVMGVASVKLKVQVKRYDYGTIKEHDIRSLRGTLDRDQEGCFITLSTFSKGAKEAADDVNKKVIKMVDGQRFIDILTDKFDEIKDIATEEGDSEMVEFLKFRRMLIPA